jgi:hypothetical protein
MPLNVVNNLPFDQLFLIGILQTSQITSIVRYSDMSGIRSSMASSAIWRLLLVADIWSLTSSTGLVTPSEIASVATVYMR